MATAPRDLPTATAALRAEARGGPAARTALRIGQALVVLVVIAAFAIQLVLLFTGGDANSGVGTGIRVWRLFSYFTIQSNLFVLGTALVLVLRPGFDGPVWRVLRLDALLGILITGLVYGIVLAPQQHITGAAEVANIGFHYVSPWATIALWLLFGPRPQLNPRTAVAAFLWPIAWLIYLFTQGAFTHWYAYPFLDVTQLGLATALRNALFVLVLAIVLAALFLLLDSRLRTLGARK